MSFLYLLPIFWIFWRLYRRFYHEKLKLTSDSVVFISGCSRGLGKAMALKLIKKYGCTLINISKTNIDPLLSELSENQQKKVHHFECDISEETKLAETLIEIRRRFSIPDLIINNAAISSVGYFLEEKDNEQLKQTLKNNTMGHIQLTRFFIFEYLKRVGIHFRFTKDNFGIQDFERSSNIKSRRKKIVISFISSIVSEASVLRFPSYSMSKALLQSFVDNLRMEMNHFKLSKFVKIVSILPGAFNSQMFHFMKDFLTVYTESVDNMSTWALRDILNLEEKAYNPWFYGLQTQLPILILPTKIVDSIFLYINRKCTININKKPIQKTE